jgi:hypothetical protein
MSTLRDKINAEIAAHSEEIQNLKEHLIALTPWLDHELEAAKLEFASLKEKLEKYL